MLLIQQIMNSRFLSLIFHWITGTEYKTWKVLLQLHKKMVRLHSDYCVQFWLLGSRRDVIKQEDADKIHKDGAWIERLL